jgi:toxin-antitoxin system PIN domain toxin
MPSGTVERMAHLLDSNIWLALSLDRHAHHATARNWLDRVQEANSVCFCRPTQQTLLRLLTTSSVLAPFGNPPLTNTEAWSVFEALLADDRILLRTEEPPGLERRWKELAVRDTASPKLWMDAYLAAFALAAGDRLVTIDRAFQQFPGLDLVLL